MTASANAAIDALSERPEHGVALRRLICEVAIAGRLLPRRGDWTKHRLESIVTVRGGSTPSMARAEFWGGDIPWISPKDMHVGDIVNSEMFITQKALAETSLELVAVGSVLIVGRSGILKRKLPAQVTRVPCTVNQDIKAMTPKDVIESSYLRLWLLGSERAILVEDVKTGTTVQSLVFPKLFSREVLLPPIAEQRSIVAKVDELMALCDRLEARQQDAEAAHARLVHALLDSLTQARDAEEFQACWQRLAGQFPIMFSTELSIEQLKRCVLQLAVEGRLVDHVGQATVGGGDLKVVPFEAPGGWVWRRFGETWEGSFYGPRFGKDDYVRAGGVPTIRTTDMTGDGLIELRSPPMVSLTPAQKETYGLRQGDLLVTRSGSIGTMALFRLELDAIPSAYLIRVRFLRTLVPEFGLLYLRSPFGQALLGLNTTSVGVPNVNATKLAEFPIAIPSVEEQHLIVAKAAELLALCDLLKARIAAARAKQVQLAEALVAEAVAA